MGWAAGPAEIIARLGVAKQNSDQCAGALGQRLLERGPVVRFLGKRWNKWAEVVDLNGFSGHADHDELLELLSPLADRAGWVRLVHGEVTNAQRLATDLRAAGFADVVVPLRGEAVAW